MSNPFSTTFGIEPTNFIARHEETDEIVSNFLSDEPSNYVYLITGMRGSGKTVFLTNLASYFAKKEKWVVVDPGPKDHLLENIAGAIYETGLVTKAFTKKEFSFSFHGLTLSISGNNPVSNVFSLIKKMLDIFRAKGIRLLITIDEVNNGPEMKAFIEAYQSFLRSGYKVMLLMTGLFENVSRLQNDENLTFLYRAPKVFLGSLSYQAMCANYKNDLGVSNELAVELAKLTKGYAYAYQVLGYLMYQSKEKAITESLLGKLDTYLADYVYEKAFSELSPLEQRIVCSLKSDSAVNFAQETLPLSIDKKALGVYRSRLIKKGILMACSYGMVAFALPRFSNFLDFYR